MNIRGGFLLLCPVNTDYHAVLFSVDKFIELMLIHW